MLTCNIGGSTRHQILTLFEVELLADGRNSADLTLRLQVAPGKLAYSWVVLTKHAYDAALELNT